MQVCLGLVFRQVVLLMLSLKCISPGVGSFQCELQNINAWDGRMPACEGLPLPM